MERGAEAGAGVLAGRDGVTEYVGVLGATEGRGLALNEGGGLLRTAGVGA